MMRYLLVLLLLTSCATLTYAADNFADANGADVNGADNTDTNTADNEIERGKYLARAADCAACHTAKDGTPYVGGYGVETPFGIVYGTNITPDAEYGIGHYSADDFFHVLTKGELPDGTQLYPAMPYTAYHDIKREDSDAMYAYFMSLDPVPVEGPQTDLPWPFSMRWSLNVWNWLFAGLDSEPTAAEDNATAAGGAERGRYLVDTLGHCGGCHTPRNVFGAMQRDKYLQGAIISGYEAPNLAAEAMAERGWDPASLRTYLRDGMSAQGSMFSEMYPVFKHSTRYLTDADLAAMENYLMDDNPPPAKKSVQSASADDSGRQLYLNSCAGCHGTNGEGVPHVASDMINNTSVRSSNPRNLVKVIHEGVAARDFGDFERRHEMPGFANILDADQTAELATWMRRQWGGQQEAVNAKTVDDITGAQEK